MNELYEMLGGMRLENVRKWERGTE